MAIISCYEKKEDKIDDIVPKGIKKGDIDKKKNNISKRNIVFTLIIRNLLCFLIVFSLA